jgi:hypothetical protein
MRAHVVLTVLLLALGLAGCNGVNMAVIKEPFTFELTQDQSPQPLQAVYCYTNMAHSADCYDVPLEPEARRLMGYYGPAPAVRGYYGRRAY